MRVLAVGGTGRIGRISSAVLAASDVVSEIAIAARGLPLAKRVASVIGPKATAIEVDAADEARLASLAADYDLIVNTAGPDFRVAYPVTRAAIAAGAHCCDIAADGPSLERTLALDASAKRAGVSVITGIGHTPGLSNLLMQHAANQLDRPEDLRLCVWWDLSRGNASLFGDPQEMRRTGRVNASWQQVFAWVAGRVRIYRDGQWIDVDPFEEQTDVRLPGGGTVTAIPIGSTEPITLPRQIRGLRSVSTWMALLPPQLYEIVRDESRKIADGQTDAARATMAFLDAITSNPNRWLASRPGIPSGFGMFASAQGEKRGHTVRYECWPASPWESTVAPLTTAALQILRGAVRARGVLAPEEAFDPIPFLEEVSRFRAKSRKPGRLLDETEEILP